MGYQFTRPDTDQVKFTSSKTGGHLLEDYLQNAELGNRTLAELLTDLFDPATGAQKEPVTPADVLAAAASALAASQSAAAAAASAAALAGGFVSSLNGQTGAVTLAPPEAIILYNLGVN